MKFRILNLLLIGSIVSSVMLSGCKKDDDNNSSGGTPITKPDVTGQIGSFIDSRDGKTYNYIGIGLST